MYKVIFRNGTEPTEVDSGGLSVYDSEIENVVVLYSGVPNVSLEKIFADILGGSVYKVGVVRIECIESNGNENECVTNPITYRLETANGNMEESPIYPMLSVMQKVILADVNMDGKLLNTDTSFKIKSIPSNTKMKYSFYPVGMINPTMSNLNSETDKKLIVPNLNNIFEVGDEGCENIGVLRESMGIAEINVNNVSVSDAGANTSTNVNDGGNSVVGGASGVGQGAAEEDDEYVLVETKTFPYWIVVAVCSLAYGLFHFSRKK